MTTLDDFAASHEDCARRLSELEATVRLLEDENARLKAELGAASFIASERTRNSIVAWLRTLYCRTPGDFPGPDDLADRIAACEDINPP